MLKNIFLLIFFIIISVLVGCDSKCKKYIIIMEQSCLGTLKPKKLNDIDWNLFNCPEDATNILSYDEIFANKSCILELNYTSSVTNVNSKITTTNRASHEFIPSDENVRYPNTNLNHSNGHITKEKPDTTEENDTNDLTLIFKTELNKSLIWHCEFVNPNYTIDEYTTESSEKYRVLDFRNCTEHFSNVNKSENSDIIMILNNKRFTFDNSNVRDVNEIKEDDFERISDRKNINLHLVLTNQSICNETVPLHIAQGRIINLWTSNDEKLIQNHYNTALVELKILNCVIHSSNRTKGDEEANESLDLDIFLNKPNNTNLNASIVSSLNGKSVNSTKRMHLFCEYPSHVRTTISSNTNSGNKLILECTFNENLAPNENQINDTNCSFMDYAVVGNCNNKIGINKATESKNEVELIPSYTTKKTETEKKKEKLQNVNYNQVLPETVTTESNTYTHQSGMMGNKGENRDISYIDPFVYIMIAITTIAVVSAVTIFALKIFRPQPYHLTSTRDWPVMEDSHF